MNYFGCHPELGGVFRNLKDIFANLSYEATPPFLGCQILILYQKVTTSPQEMEGPL